MRRGNSSIPLFFIIHEKLTVSVTDRQGRLPITVKNPAFRKAGFPTLIINYYPI